MSKRKKIVTIISIIITILIVSILLFFLYDNKSIFQNLKNLKTSYIIILIFLSIADLNFQGYVLKLLTKPFNINLKEHFMLYTASGFLNIVTPFKGGAGLRAMYMKRIYKLNYSHFVSSFFGNYILIFLVSSSLSLIATFLLYYRYDIFNLYTTSVFLFILVSTIILTFLNGRFKKENFITCKLNKLINGWKIIRKDVKNLLYIMGLIAINILMATFINQMTFLGLGLKIPFIYAFYLSIMRILAIFLNFTPGALGITEALYYSTANILNISPELSVLAALIMRTVRISLLLTLGPIFNVILINKIRKMKTYQTPKTI